MSRPSQSPLRGSSEPMESASGELCPRKGCVEQYGLPSPAKGRLSRGCGSALQPVQGRVNPREGEELQDKVGTRSDRYQVARRNSGWE